MAKKLKKMTITKAVKVLSKSIAKREAKRKSETPEERRTRIYNERVELQKKETSERELPRLRELLANFNEAKEEDAKTKTAQAIMGIATSTSQFFKDKEYLFVQKVAEDYLNAIKDALNKKRQEELEAKKKSLIGKKATFTEDYSFVGMQGEGRYINKGVSGEVLDVKRDYDYHDNHKKFLILVKIEESPIFHIRIKVEEEALTFA